MSVSDQLQEQLQRWTNAGLLDRESGQRILEFESAREVPGVRWPVVFAIVFGSIMVAAGVLLFVAAHWQDLSPTRRFLLVLAMIAGFHLAAGAIKPRFQTLGDALHGIGTVALGAGIFLAGQIFNLREHWPGGILLWAIGALLSWLLLRDWIQATLSAFLIPGWIAAEWSVQAQHYNGMERILLQFLTMMAISYLSARSYQMNSYFRRALTGAGNVALLPLCAALAAGSGEWGFLRQYPMPLSFHIAGPLLAFVIPLLVAYFLRGKSIMWNLSYALWVFALGLLDARITFQNLSLYGLCALASIGLVFWGLQEQRTDRINLGIAGFAITLAVFYFSNVMDKLGRSAALVAFGILFLLGGWKLEQLRRRLVARATGAAL